MRPKDAQSGAGGAGAAEGRSTAAPSEQTRMACYRTATDSHAEKSCSGAGGAGAASEGRSAAGTEQASRSVMWSEQLERVT